MSPAHRVIEECAIYGGAIAGMPVLRRLVFVVASGNNANASARCRARRTGEGMAKRRKVNRSPLFAGIE